MHLPTLTLLEQLITRASLTPDDAGCQALIRERLSPLGFDCTDLPFGPADAVVSNLWAVRAGSRPGPTLVLAGHTDVVPTGPREQWTSDPFVPSHRDGKLYGRGAADMKTSLAAMVVAVEEFVAAHPDHAGRIAFLLTSDEEGPSIDGTVKVCDWLAARGETLDACIVGEPTSVHQATLPIPTWRATPSAWPCPRWRSWPPSAGTRATTTSRPPAGRCRTSTPAPAPPT
jgi:succinyl-diaminopimelate desuccinylase